jgi:hypothetical protein
MDLRLAIEYQLQVLVLPIELASFDVAMAWRSVVPNDPAIMWLRQELRDIGETIDTLMWAIG